MVYINEWLPNPEGKDAGGEFVEVFNSGKKAVNLSGWTLKANSKTKFVLSGEIDPGEFLVFQKPALKISLVNTDGQVFLYDANGKLVESQKFLGTAQEGKSFSKSPEGFFMFSEPTPGKLNQFSEAVALLKSTYSEDVTLKNQVGVFDFVLLTLGVAVVLTGLIMYVLKKNEDLSQLFFGRDEVTWR